MIIGELACGFLNPRIEIFLMLTTLLQATVADHNEALELIEKNI